ncbi:helix-turn-helix transcriptional regulator [Saxibacter everestensis]|uniref:Helix-turn-helix transcriptional regulator n=1 Tax=Saxibacter everestensis TaxID=2909229 RepID=A0ABY8QTB6_9MICO|nr:helix-turn-helix transcriptional regulator [Brevibacteriaceae bacterium ZFBP1038]
MEGDLQKTLGRNLRTHREARGLSQEQFADVLGVHRTYMGGVERGERNLTLKSVERLADAIAVDALELLTEGFTALPEPAGRKDLGEAGETVSVEGMQTHKKSRRR